MKQSVVPVILCGGSGTRLWPLSRELHPKQFLSLAGERTLFQETLLRLRPLADRLRPPIIVSNESHRFAVAEQMRRVGVSAQTIVLEPIGRNTAPAVAIAAWLALEGSGRSASADEGAPDPLLLVMPADHVVANEDAFARAARTAFDVAADGYLVTFGIVPTRPETGYGYIRRGARGNDAGDWFVLERFVEKPDAETARSYVDSGEYLWNSGMFVFSARRYLEELERHEPQIAAACRAALTEASRDPDFTRLDERFRECPSNSIDYAVMEKADRAAVVPLDAGWSDVGSWPALYEVLASDADGNVLRGDVIAHGCRGSYIASSSRLVAAVGVEDFVIVETSDAVLVMPRAAGQDVKRIVDALRDAGREELRVHPEPPSQ